MAIEKLLSREEFRTQCLARDGNKCVVCSSTNDLAVHHIIERRLFSNGGYYMENGATLCPECHIKAEETNLSCEEIRKAVGIQRLVLPDHFYHDLDYDKWGNIIIGERRLRGELFFDPSVQKILSQGDVLNLFDDYVKYPRTMHLPWSNPSKDDKIIKDLSAFHGQEVVVTEKMDGENFNGYRNYCHARSLEPLYGVDRGRAKSIWNSVSHDFPEGWRCCAENLFAKHSIHYSNLESYLLVFSIWNEQNECLDWDTTVEWCELLGLAHVPVLYRGVWNIESVQDLYDPSSREICEGYVVRVARGFTYSEFKSCVAKYVREGHVNTTMKHWRSAKIIPNKLKNQSS